MGNSGLFVENGWDGPIDDIKEVGAAVDEIMNTQTETDAGGQQAPDAASLLILQEYVRRVRLLTWAVGIIALVLILKEVE